MRSVLTGGCVAALLGLGSGGAAIAAVDRPVVFLDGDAGVRSLDSEEILLTPAATLGPEFGSSVAFGHVDGPADPSAPRFADAVIGQRGRNRLLIHLGAAVPRGAPWFDVPSAADIVITAPSGTSDRTQQFGFSVAVLDLDGDGFDDILAGAPFSDPGGRTDAGLAWAILGLGPVAAGPGFQSPLEFGLDAPPAGVRVIRITRGAAAKGGDLLGFAVGAGRLASLSDTFAVITARDADAAGPARADAGAAHVVLGSAFPPATGDLDLQTASVATFYGDDAADAFGESVAACDVDGAGDDDLLVGAIFGDGPANNGNNRGEMTLFLGENIATGFHAGDQTAGVAALSIHGASDGDDLGYTVACGDVNGDLLADLMAGAIFADAIGDASPTAGEAYLFRGRVSQVDPNNPARRELIDPRTAAPQLPLDLSIATDPGDPAPDAADLVLFGATTADQLGFSLGVGDLNGDGVGDLIAGARRYDRDRTLVNVGATYLLLGSAGFLDPGAIGATRGIDLHAGTSRDVDPNFIMPVNHLPLRVDGIVVGASRDDHSSWAVAAGDLNGDGVDELMIGAIGDLARTPGFRGEVYILSYTDIDRDGASDLVDVDNDNDGIADTDEVSGALTGGIPTDPFDEDTDDDGVQDGTELGVTCAGSGGPREVPCDDPGAPFTATDPNLPFHFIEDQNPATTTDPTDGDTDDDGLPDGSASGGVMGEDLDRNGRLDSGESDPSDHDTDGDLVFDGTERGVTAPLADTDVSSCPPPDPACHFRPDADGGQAGSTTKPDNADSDGDGLDDGVEDLDADGAVAGDTQLDHLVGPAEIWSETDAADPDTDRDGLPDGVEVTRGTDPLDQDTDDDGLPDGVTLGGVPGEDLDGDGVIDAGESSPLAFDTDGDGLTDGVERGLAVMGVPGRNGTADTGPGEDGTDVTSTATLVLDADEGRNGSVTNPNSADSDGDMIPDAVEDADRDGAVAGDVNRDHLIEMTAEIWTETDAADPDTDRDGTPDGLEDADRDGARDAGETDPLDQDSDDDGLPDGWIDGANSVSAPDGVFQAREGEDRDRDGVFGTAEGESSPLLVDSDGDGLRDGLEAGAVTGVPGRNGAFDGGADGTDTASSAFLPVDADPATDTEPWDADTDEDGLPDGFIDGHNPNSGSAPEGDPNNGAGEVYEGEDINLNGALDAGETSPRDNDTDGDGVRDGVERGVQLAERVLGPDNLADDLNGLGVQDGTGGPPAPLFDADDATVTDALDRDSDDDGLSDGTEDTMGNGAVDPTESDPSDPDTDDDLLPDGLEVGDTTPEIPGTDLGAGTPFRADQDPNTRTLPYDADTDGGGTQDGAEDADRNGRVDPPEQDPGDRTDDDRTGPVEFTDTLNGSVITTLPAGSTIFVRLNDDTDENLDPNVVETVPVTCASSFPDSETFLLLAIGPDTGVFAGSVATATTGTAVNDTVLSVGQGGTVTCTYTDDDDPPDARMAVLASTGTSLPVIPELDIDLAADGWMAWRPEGSSAAPPALIYNVYRGDPAALRSTGTYALQAAVCGLAGPEWLDPALPAAGAAYFYLVAGQQDGLEGSLGEDSAGRPRPAGGGCAP